MNQLLNKKWLLATFSILIFGIYIFPYFDIENTIIRRHDNLDSYFVYYHILALTDAIFITDPMYSIENIMNGLPRFCLPSSLNFIAWIFYFFGSKTGYVINLIIVHITGFIGMYLLLKNYFLTDAKKYYLLVLLSLSFALLPVFSIFGLSFMGQPILLYAILKIKQNRSNWHHWLIIILFPFYGSLVFSGFFILVGLSLWFVYDTISNKRINQHMTLAIFLLGVLHIIVDYQLFYGMFFSDFVSQRGEVISNSLNFKGVIHAIATILLNGWYHSANYFGIILLGTAITTIFVGLHQKWNLKKLHLFLILFLFLGCMSTILEWGKLNLIYENFPALAKFSFKKISFLFPIFAFLIFALSINHLSNLKKSYIYLLPLLTIILASNFVMNQTFEKNGWNSDLLKRPDNSGNGISISKHFDESLYNRVKTYINKPQEEYRVITLGILPTTLQYNGFYTLGGYQNLYSKEYSEIFYKIHEREYLKAGIKASRMESHCYLFSADVFKGKDKITDWNIDAAILKELECEYLISQYEILNASKLHLKLEKKFISDKHSNDVYLYSIPYS